MLKAIYNLFIKNVLGFFHLFASLFFAANDSFVCVYVCVCLCVCVCVCVCVCDVLYGCVQLSGLQLPGESGPSLPGNTQGVQSLQTNEGHPHLRFLCM